MAPRTIVAYDAIIRYPNVSFIGNPITRANFIVFMIEFACDKNRKKNKGVMEK